MVIGQDVRRRRPRRSRSDEEEAGGGGRRWRPARVRDERTTSSISGSSGRRGTPGAGRNKLDSLLTLQVDDVAQDVRLDRVQKKKLVLAGRGDIKRFFEKVEEKRKKFDKVKTDQNKVGEIYQELLPLQVTLNRGCSTRDRSTPRPSRRC